MHKTLAVVRPTLCSIIATLMQISTAKMYLEPVERVGEGLDHCQSSKSGERNTTLTCELITKPTLCGIDAYTHYNLPPAEISAHTIREYTCNLSLDHNQMTRIKSLEKFCQSSGIKWLSNHNNHKPAASSKQELSNAQQSALNVHA